MKHKLVILCLFIACAVQAQLSEIYNVTSLFYQNGKFYEQQVIVYSDSSSDIKNKILSDTATVVNRVIGAVIGETRQHAQIQVQAARKPRVLETIAGLDSALFKATGINLRDTVRNYFTFVDSLGARKHLLEGTDYTFVDTTSKSAAIIRQANGNLRFRVLPTATTYGITFFSDAFFRVTSYPSAGQFVDFFFDQETGVFISDTRTAQGRPWRLRKASLAKPGVGQSASQTQK